MRVIACVLLLVSAAFAYQVTYPSESEGWNTTGPNYLKWERVNTDPTNFAVVLTNENFAYDEILDANIDGTVGSVQCSTPSGGWPSGSGFRVNIAQDAQHLTSLLAQSSEFNITNTSSATTTTSSASILITSSVATATSSAASLSSSVTSTTPTGTSAASPGTDVHTSLLAAVAALAVLTTFF